MQKAFDKLLLGSTPRLPQQLQCLLHLSTTHANSNERPSGPPPLSLRASAPAYECLLGETPTLLEARGRGLLGKTTWKDYLERYRYLHVPQPAERLRSPCRAAAVSWVLMNRLWTGSRDFGAVRVPKIGTESAAWPCERTSPHLHLHQPPCLLASFLPFFIHSSVPP